TLDIQVSELQKQRWKNAALEAAGEAILIADAQGNIQYTNAAFTRITGYDTSTVLGKNCSILSSGLTSLDTYNELWSGLNQNGLWHGELTNKRSNSDIFTQLTTISALYDENTDPPVHQGYIAVMRDISLRKELEQELYILARQDGLTGILNRKTVLDEAEKKLQWSIRYDDPLSVIVLDIDHFKRVNDR
ncbi:PAS domain S-box protein, partial [Oceanospirillum sp. HFRX-1_2]